MTFLRVLDYEGGVECERDDHTPAWDFQIIILEVQPTGRKQNS